jgi:hypothetical protein
MSQDDYYAVRDRVNAIFNRQTEGTKLKMAAMFAGGVGTRLVLDLRKVLKGEAGDAADKALLNALRDVESRYSH